jgi:inhibitor of KinA sporulation pathway (predicted exonuclease)
VVLDFEATCEDRDVVGAAVSRQARAQQEIIEFPSVLVDLHTHTLVDEFQRYIRPVLRPRLSAFCTGLTGITQPTVDAGVTFEEAVGDHREWLCSHGLLRGAKARGAEQGAEEGAEEGGGRRSCS